MSDHRHQRRIAADLPVTIVTVLDNRAGRIVDVSAGGVQITEASFPPGTRLQIDHGDQTLFGRVMWQDGDRMGVRFEVPLGKGPVGDLVAEIGPRALPREISVARPQLRLGFGRRFA